MFNVQCLIFNYNVFSFRTMAMYHSYNAHVRFVHSINTKLKAPSHPNNKCRFFI